MLLLSLPALRNYDDRNDFRYANHLSSYLSVFRGTFATLKVKTTVASTGKNVGVDAFFFSYPNCACIVSLEVVVDLIPFLVFDSSHILVRRLHVLVCMSL